MTSSVEEIKELERIAYKYIKFMYGCTSIEEFCKIYEVDYDWLKVRCWSIFMKYKWKAIIGGWKLISF